MEEVRIVLGWVADYLPVITTAVLFFVYFRLNKRQKAAEVKQAEASAKHTEADVKQAEAGVISTIQDVYDRFAETYKKEWQEINDDMNTLKQDMGVLKQSDREKTVTIGELERKNKGLSREVGQLKTAISETEKVLSEVENLACIKLGCKDRDPAIGNYKHKREA